jgi:hypothetical protein
MSLSFVHFTVSPVSIVAVFGSNVRSPGIVTVWIDDDCPFRHPAVLRVAKIAVVSRNTVRRL